MHLIRKNEVMGDLLRIKSTRLNVIVDVLALSASPRKLHFRNNLRVTYIRLVGERPLQIEGAENAHYNTKSYYKRRKEQATNSA